jgi:hypothetical protein
MPPPPQFVQTPSPRTSLSAYAPAQARHDDTPQAATPAHHPPQQPQPLYVPQPHAGKFFSHVYVGNLSALVTEEMLYELFLQAGPVESVVVSTDATGRPAGFGFVDFVDDLSGAYACHLLHETRLCGRPLTVRPSNRSLGQ